MDIGQALLLGAGVVSTALGVHMLRHRKSLPAVHTFYSTQLMLFGLTGGPILILFGLGVIRLD